MSLNCPWFWAKSEPHCPCKIVLLKKKECRTSPLCHSSTSFRAERRPVELGRVERSGVEWREGWPDGQTDGRTDENSPLCSTGILGQDNRRNHLDKIKVKWGFGNDHLDKIKVEWGFGKNYLDKMNTFYSIFSNNFFE